MSITQLSSARVATGGYRPQHGQLTTVQIEKGVREFVQRVENGENDVIVAVATGVPIKKLHGRTLYRFRSVSFEMRYEDSANDPATTFDVFVTKVVGEFHERAVATITMQLNTGFILSPGGGSMTMAIPRTRRHVVREPDQALRPKYSSAGDNPVRPRLIVEVEVKNRSVRGVHQLAREYFRLIPQLRAVLIVKFFGRRVDGTFACLAILYRRINGIVTAADVVSFGSAPLLILVIQNLQRYGLHENFRDLPLVPLLVPNQARPCPWCAGDRFIHIPAADVFADAVQINNQPIQVPPTGFPDIRIDLWTLFTEVEPMDF